MKITEYKIEMKFDGIWRKAHDPNCTKYAVRSEEEAREMLGNIISSWHNMKREIPRLKTPTEYKIFKRTVSPWEEV